MKAAPDAQQRLLELAEHDRRIAQLARLERDLPEVTALNLLVAERATVRADLGTTSGVLEDARIELGRTESDVAVVAARVARDTERMMASSSAKDASAFEHEIESLRKRQNDLEEIELAVMERVEQHEAAVAGIQARLDGLDAGVAAADLAVNAARERISAELVEIQRARGAVVGDLPTDLVALYEKQRERYGVGASLLRRGVSEASGFALLADELARVKAAAPDDVLLCPSSEAILVRTSESGL